MNPFSRLISALATLIIVVIIGTIGYHLIEGWNFLDPCYMVIITLFTVGFQEVHSLSPYGRIFTMCIIVVGVGTAVYAGSQIVKIIVEGEVIGYGRRRKMEKEIKEMKDHFIICGFGRTGHQVAKEFDAVRVPYVVVDRKEKTEEELIPKGIPYIIGDITFQEKEWQPGQQSQ